MYLVENGRNTLNTVDTTYLSGFPVFWIPLASSRLQYLFLKDRILHRRDLESHSNWNVSVSEMSSWLAERSRPEKKKKLQQLIYTFKYFIYYMLL